jgi:uncharacterized membrane protein
MLKRMRVRIERVKESLFFVPALWVIVAVAAAELLLGWDRMLIAQGQPVPAWLQSTAASARVTLSTIAGATITVAGVVFAFTLVSIQLASSQFSPRVIPAFLRDPFQQQVMGLVVGTFSYCLIVLGAVRDVDAFGQGGLVPHVSTGVAVVLSILSILGLLAFLDHSARSMQVGEIIRQRTAETCRRIRDLYPEPATAIANGDAAEPLPPGDHRVVRAAESGWVRHLDIGALLKLTPAGGTLRLEIRNGSFVAPGQQVATVWPVPNDWEEFERMARQAIVLGSSRLVLHDVAFGIRQLVDIGLRALSPGINDPTTAYDVIVHLGVVLRELLWRDLAPTTRTADDRRLIAANDLSHADYVKRALDQIRLAGADQPAVAATLIQLLGDIAADLAEAGLNDRVALVREMNDTVLATYVASHPLPVDLERMVELARTHGLTSA